MNGRCPPPAFFFLSWFTFSMRNISCFSKNSYSQKYCLKAKNITCKCSPHCLLGFVCLQLSLSSLGWVPSLGYICCNMPWSHSLLERESICITADTVQLATLTGKKDGHVRKLHCHLHEVLHFFNVYVPTYIHIPKLPAFGCVFYILIFFFS